MDKSPITGNKTKVTCNKNSQPFIFSLAFAILILSSVFIPTASAQNSGKIEATYQVEILREIPPVKDAQIRTIISKMTAALDNLDYLLRIENGKSLFEREESLSREENELYDDLADTWTGLNLQTYTNKEENVQVVKKEGLGKEFIIKQRLPDFQWRLTGEKKLIRDFPAQKALGTFNNVEGKSTEVVAWYTPAIPLQFGPDIFQGLPGLILEAEFSERRIVLTQLEIDPDKSFNITEPVDGEATTLEEYRSKGERTMEIMGF